MASDAASQPLLTTKIAEGHLRCSICSNRFSQPKMLSCSHSFCLKCLEELVQPQDQGHNTTISCPLCKHETTLEGTVADLPHNDRLSALLEQAPRKEKIWHCQRDKLRSTHNYELKAETKEFALHQKSAWKGANVASFSNNDLIVLDFGLRKFLLLTRDAESTLITQTLEIEGLTRPEAIAVNKDDQLIVLDRNITVKTFNRDCQLLHQFALPDFIAAEPYLHPRLSLAVDESNRIWVGNFRSLKIAQFQPDGSHIGTVPITSRGSAAYASKPFASCKKQLIYTEHIARELRSLDCRGDKVFSIQFTITGYHHWIPDSVFWHTDGSIYVLVHLFNNNRPVASDILCFRPDACDGDYGELVIKTAGQVRGITITSLGDLVVVTNTSVKIYKIHSDTH